MKKMHLYPALCAAALAVAGCTATPAGETGNAGSGDASAARGGGTDWRQAALDVMRGSFRDRGIATKDRIEQDDLQRVCSQYPDGNVPKAIAARLEKAQESTIRQPADGKYMGDWRAGERIAQTGVGWQWSDTAQTVAGGNCYACHQLSKAELSFGNLGPSLYNYGKLRGQSDAVVKYTWGRLWNSQAYNACNNMPRFGHKGLLTEAQLKDLMALLLDPASPVNQ